MNEYEIIIPPPLADLIPAFMENRRNELASIEAAFASGDLEALGKLALSLKSFGVAHGFERIAALATELQESAERGDYDAAGAYILLYRDYLDRVRIAPSA
jgi:HPt (histidine-containing phosphotransfer) domain-containing protein